MSAQMNLNYLIEQY